MYHDRARFAYKQKIPLTQTLKKTKQMRNIHDVEKKVSHAPNDFETTRTLITPISLW